MIKSVRIKNFKCFRDDTFGFAPLTLFTGLNGSGKSSVLQALLLSELASTRSDVPLAGEHGLALGVALDILNRDSSERTIELRSNYDEGDRYTALEFTDDEAVSLSVSPRSRADGGLPALGAYLGAERLGPRDALEVAPQPDSEVGVGHQGQYTAQVLAAFDRTPVEEQRRHPSSESPMVSKQAEAWLSTIVRPVSIEARRLVGTSLATLRFRESFSATADWLRPTNVGFGLSYALPIVVSALTVSSGTALIIENPEAHLHPAGQAWMGEFLARIAAAGVQVLIESHSDHVLNGLRRAVVGGGSLDSEDLRVHFFGEADSVEIRMGGRGDLSSWPTHFFDQIESDLVTISRRARQQ